MSYQVIDKLIYDTRGNHSINDFTNAPAPTIITVPYHYQVYYHIQEHPPMMQEQPVSDKPPYHVPSMADINALPWNGYNVVSTFSGAGGSCLGYRMAGFRVLWANEFIPAAQDTYRLNHPTSILDTRDIRTIQPDDILQHTGMRVGEIDILDGSPPCAAFSTAGKREKSWGKVKQYSDSKQRVDDLFYEYIRLIKGLQPKTFVAENVSGLVKGTAKGYFKEILRAMRDCGYTVEARLLDASWLGVPQKRQRLIFVGVRNDLAEAHHVAPSFPEPMTYQYTVREAIPWVIKQGANGSYGSAHWQEATNPSPTIGASPATGNGQSPPSIIEAETDISKYAIGAEWDKMKLHGQSNSDKYLNLKRPDLDKPCYTVSQVSGQSGAASITHPTEKRKFTIAELKRICAFPDDFQLTGSYAQQWERLGRSVPPVMMMHIAGAVWDGVLKKCAG